MVLRASRKRADPSLLAMQLVMMVTARCNASCRHCSTSCGPDRTESLSREAIQRVITEASAIKDGDPLQISITGGEPFLDFQQLKEIVRFGTARGAVMSCVSNGYWASSLDRATRLLQDLKDCGLALLAISTSTFHTEYIARQRVERALNAARDVGIECVLKFVQTAADRNVDELQEWARGAGASRVELIPLMPTIREHESLRPDAYLRTSGLPSGTCPGAIINITETQKVYMCCTPGAVQGFYTLGDISDTHLKDIQDRFHLGPKQQILRTYGPIYFANAVRGAGLGDRLRSAYTSVCDLCTHIASDPEMAAVAARASEAFALTQLQSLLTECSAESEELPT